MNSILEKILEKITDYLKPKAHDVIDAITQKWEESQKQRIPSITEGLSPEHEELIQNFAMGGLGGGAGKGVRQLILALKGKIKGGKMIPSQPIRKGTIGGPKKEIIGPPQYTDTSHKYVDKLTDPYTYKPLPKKTVLSKLDILLNKLKDNPNIGGNINRVMLENVKKYKPKK